MAMLPAPPRPWDAKAELIVDEIAGDRVDSGALIEPAFEKESSSEMDEWEGGRRVIYGRVRVCVGADRG